VERCVAEDEGEETLSALGNDEALRLERVQVLLQIKLA
jgi:hypothetical protein